MSEERESVRERERERVREKAQSGG